MMIQRTLRPTLERLVGPYPVVFLTGPRQSGKTTLARACLPQFSYMTLEDLETRAEAIEDPRGFLARFEGSSGVILDEAQRAPELFSYLQGVVDESRAGPFVLTGSQNFLLSEHIGQSLAGRVAVLELLPFSLAELLRRRAREPAELTLGRPTARHDPAEPSGGPPVPPLDEMLWRGQFPPIHDRALEPTRWLDGYVRTYVERDLRTLANVGDLDTFVRFLGLCAGRAGQLLNMSSIGADAGIDQGTVRRWLSILRASYVIDVLQPHHANFRKRIVKTPKLYFVDSGLLCYLLGIRSSEQLMRHPLRGAVFENFVVSELRKLFVHHGERAPLNFWRDSTGREVDLLIERAQTLLPIEIKAGQTVAGDFFDGIDYFRRISQTPAGGILVYGGRSSYLRTGHQVLSWADCS